MVNCEKFSYDTQFFFGGADVLELDTSLREALADSSCLNALSSLIGNTDLFLFNTCFSRFLTYHNFLGTNSDFLFTGISSGDFLLFVLQTSKLRFVFASVDERAVTDLTRFLLAQGALDYFFFLDDLIVYTLGVRNPFAQSSENFLGDLRAKIQIFKEDLLIVLDASSDVEQSLRQVLGISAGDTAD
jgi:hypothetical protein